MSTSINKNIDDLSKNCRLCLKIGKNIRNIFNDNDKKWAMTDISQLIYECTNIEVNILFTHLLHDNSNLNSLLIV